MVNVLQRQKVFRRPEQVSRTNSATITAKTAALPAFISFKPLAFLTSLLDRFGHKELILSAGVVISLLLFYQLNSRESMLSINLPVESETNDVLWRYLVPVDNSATTEIKLNPEAIKNLMIKSYKVKRGDTLSAIAQKYSLNLDTLLSYNNIRKAAALKVGSVLEIPNSDGLKYRVKRGDYLGGIAKKFQVSLNSLLDWNNLETSVITPAQDLFIPGARMSANELNRILGKLFIYPARGRITSRFGMRKHPFTGIKRFHNGVDIANDTGTPVLAAMSGQVAMIGYNANFGKYIIVRHGDGFQTLYGHLSVFQVSKNERVNQGQLLGKIGNTGYSTGSHLHFSIFLKGEPVDPFKYLH
jgi:murein DD-endopeptidase MepM/ murein hydrolase activator NlpD